MNNSIENDVNPPHTIINIGQGHHHFDLKLCIEKFHNPSQIIFNHSHNNPCWLSYRFFGRVLQSEILSCDNPTTTPASVSFTPMTHTFRVCSSFPELVQHFGQKKNGVLRVHVCTTGQVLGTAVIDLLPLIEKDEGKTKAEAELLDGGKMISGEYEVRPSAKETNSCDNETNNARLAVSVCLESESGQKATLFSMKNKLQSCSTRICASTCSQTDLVGSGETNKDCTSSPIVTSSANKQRMDDEHSTTLRQQQLEDKEVELKEREDKFHLKETKLYESEIGLEKKRRDWENWRHGEEFKFHEKLRQKEANAMRSIEDRVSTIEKERLDSLESSRKEYEKLESRLRNALMEVEVKERHSKEAEAMHQNERQRKMAELDLRERLMKEELQHTIDIEASYCWIVECTHDKHIFSFTDVDIILTHLIRYVATACKDKCCNRESRCSREVGSSCGVKNKTLGR